MEVTLCIWILKQRIKLKVHIWKSWEYRSQWWIENWMMSSWKCYMHWNIAELRFHSFLYLCMALKTEKLAVKKKVKYQVLQKISNLFQHFLFHYFTNFLFTVPLCFPNSHYLLSGNPISSFICLCWAKCKPVWICILSNHEIIPLFTVWNHFLSNCKPRHFQLFYFSILDFRQLSNYVEFCKIKLIQLSTNSYHLISNVHSAVLDKHCAKVIT